MCYKLKELKGLNKFSTNNVTNMRNMFEKCNELENLDLSHFDKSNVTEIKNMLVECKKYGRNF